MVKLPITKDNKNKQSVVECPIAGVIIETKVCKKSCSYCIKIEKDDMECDFK